MNIQSITPALRNRRLKKLLIVTVVLLIVAVFNHIYYYKPQLDTHIQLNHQINDLKNQLLSLKSLNDPGINVQALAINAQQINQKLNYAVDSLKLSKLIHKLSKQHDIKIIRQTNSAGIEQGKWLSLKQTLAIEGGYRQLRAFIEGIYQLPSMTIIQEAVIQKKPNGRKQLTGSLQLLTFQNRLLSS